MKFDDSTLYNIKSNLCGKRYSLYELATWKNGLAFRKTDFSDSGRPIIKIAELNNGVNSNTSYTNGNFGDEVSLHWDDILFSWSGNPQTSIDVFRYRLKDGWLNQHIFKVTPKKDLVSKDYFYYVLKFLKPVFTKIASNKQTTGLGHVTITDLKRLNLIIPEIKLQNKIACILKTIDDKIEINKEINKNLEMQAQALFQEWFIFNPDSAYWNTGTFSDIIESIIAGDWGKESLQGNYTQAVYCIRGADIPEVKMGNKGKMPTRYILPKNYKTKHLTDGDVIVEISGGSPTQSTGRIAAVSQSLLDRYNKDMVCTNFCKALKPKKGYSMFLYYYWQYLYNKNFFFSYENGTTGIKNLDITGFIENEPIVLPPSTLIKKFDDICHNIFAETFANGLESEQLTSIRNSLLPQLMSGEIDVSNIDF